MLLFRIPVRFSQHTWHLFTYTGLLVVDYFMEVVGVSRGSEFHCTPDWLRLKTTGYNVINFPVDAVYFSPPQFLYHSFIYSSIPLFAFSFIQVCFSVHTFKNTIFQINYSLFPASTGNVISTLIRWIVIDKPHKQTKYSIILVFELNSLIHSCTLSG